MWNELPFDEYRSHQDLALRQWLDEEVIAYAPYWQVRLKDLVIPSVEALKDIPAASEQDVVSRGGAGNPGLMLTPTEADMRQRASLRQLFSRMRQGTSVTARREALNYRYKPIHVHESGVDALLAIAWSGQDLDRALHHGRQLAKVLGLEPTDTLVNLVPAGPTLDFWGILHLGRGNALVSIHPRGMGESVLGPAKRAFGILPASVVAVPTHEAATLIESLFDEGVKRPHLKVLLCVGEVPDEGLRAQLATMAHRVAGAPVRIQAVWGPSAGRVLYGEPPLPEDVDPAEFHGLMTYGDTEVLTVRNPQDGYSVDNGEMGELVYTSLGWAGTALVQYATGTKVEGLLEGEPHPYTGSTAPRLIGRIQEAAWQPLVTTAPKGVRPTPESLERPDFRGLQPAIEQALAKANVGEWALVVQQQRLIIQVDRIDRPAVFGTKKAIGVHCGVDPTIEVTPRRVSSLRRILGGRIGGDRAD